MSSLSESAATRKRVRPGDGAIVYVAQPMPVSPDHRMTRLGTWASPTGLLGVLGSPDHYISNAILLPDKILAAADLFWSCDSFGQRAIPSGDLASLPAGYGYDSPFAQGTPGAYASPCDEPGLALYIDESPPPRTLIGALVPLTNARVEASVADVVGAIDVQATGLVAEALTGTDIKIVAVRGFRSRDDHEWAQLVFVPESQPEVGADVWRRLLDTWADLVTQLADRHPKLASVLFDQFSLEI
jgi:hypothetical protein